MNNGDSAWVIEDECSEPCAPIYWAGPYKWSQNHMDAVRFARPVDAEKVVSLMGTGYHRVCEHEWGSSSVDLSQVYGAALKKVIEHLRDGDDKAAFGVARLCLQRFPVPTGHRIQPPQGDEK